MKRKLLLATITAIVMLTGCTGLDFGAVLDLAVNTPGELQYTATIEVDELGRITNVSFSSETLPITVRTRPGSIGATIEGYSLTFYLADGSEVIPGDSTLFRDTETEVLPGRTCATGEPLFACSLGDIRYVWSPEVAFTAIAAVPGQMAARLFDNNRPNIGAYAILSIRGVDDLNRRFEIERTIGITATGDFIPASLTEKPE